MAYVRGEGGAPLTSLLADTSVSRPSLVENLKNVTLKSKQAGRKGTKRKALMYKGPTSDHQEVSKKRVASSGHPVPTPPLRGRGSTVSTGS